MLVDLVGKKSVIKFKVITEDGLNKITGLFSELKSEIEREYSDHIVELLYEIKTKDQMYSGPSLQEFEKEYKKKYKADNIRITLQVSGRQQLNPIMANIILTLDRVQESSISVFGRNNSWVNGVFSRFNEILEGLPTRNMILHNVIFEMSIQLLAVIILTTLSVFLSNKLASLVQIRFSEVYVFVVIFLLFSNLWVYMGRGLTAVRKTFYPVVDIIKLPRKPVFLTILLFVLLAAASWTVTYIIELLLPTTGQ